MINLTEKERQMLERIATDQYQDGRTGDELVNHEIWSFSPCGSHSAAALLGSLVKKGLCGSREDKAKLNSDPGCKLDSSTCWLTKTGVEALKNLNPDKKAGKKEGEKRMFWVVCTNMSLKRKRVERFIILATEQTAEQVWNDNKPGSHYRLERIEEEPSECIYHGRSTVSLPPKG